MTGAPRPLAPGEESRLASLFEATYGAAWRARTCVERYLGRTPWPASVSVIELGGRLVGAQPAYDVPLWAAGHDRMATVLVDVVTHPAYRRRGIFSRVVDHAVDQSSTRGNCVALTTPNRASFPGFRKKPDWFVLARLECRVVLLRPERLLHERYRLPSWVARLLSAPLRVALHGRRQGPDPAATRPAWPATDSIDALWAGVAPPRGVMQRRDAAWMRWRFSPGLPGSPYHCITVAAGGRLQGYAVTRVKEVDGVPVAFLVDGLAVASEEVRGRLIDATLAWADSAGAALVVFFARPGADWSRSAARSGFRRVPSPLAGRPYRVCANLRAAGKDRATLAASGSWTMSLADSDLA